MSVRKGQSMNTSVGTTALSQEQINEWALTFLNECEAHGILLGSIMPSEFTAAQRDRDNGLSPDEAVHNLQAVRYQK